MQSMTVRQRVVLAEGHDLVRGKGGTSIGATRNIAIVDIMGIRRAKKKRKASIIIEIKTTAKDVENRGGPERTKTRNVGVVDLKKRMNVVVKGTGRCDQATMMSVLDACDGLWT